MSEFGQIVFLIGYFLTITFLLNEIFDSFNGLLKVLIVSLIWLFCFGPIFLMIKYGGFLLNAFLLTVVFVFNWISKTYVKK